MTDAQAGELVKAIKEIAIERLAIAFDSEDANSVASALNAIASETGAVGEAINYLASEVEKIADLFEKFLQSR